MKNCAWSRTLGAGKRAGLVVATVVLAGCATTQPRWAGRSHPTTPQQMSEIRSIAALPADLTVAQLTAGGVSEVRDDWTESARTHARAVLESMQSQRVAFLDDLETRPEFADEIREVRALFALIDANYTVFGMSMMAAPTAQFDFSVGSIERLLDAAHADALLVIGGKDEIFTADRKVMAALSIVASAALTGSVIAPGSGVAHVSAGLIGRDGTVLWWNFVGDGQIADLRTPEGVSTTMQRLLGPMPQATAPLTAGGDSEREPATGSAPASSESEATPAAASDHEADPAANVGESTAEPLDASAAAPPAPSA